MAFVQCTHSLGGCQQRGRQAASQPRWRGKLAQSGERGKMRDKPAVEGAIHWQATTLKNTPFSCHVAHFRNVAYSHCSSGCFSKCHPGITALSWKRDHLDGLQNCFRSSFLGLELFSISRREPERWKILKGFPELDRYHLRHSTRPNSCWMCLVINGHWTLMSTPAFSENKNMQIPENIS